MIIKILIVGSGALATLFAARFSGAGLDVTLLASWSGAIEALNKSGARMVNSDGTSAQFPVRAISEPSECVDADISLVLVKAWQTRRAAQQLTQCLPEKGLTVTLQNGLGNREILSASLGQDRVVLGVTTLGATLIGPGQVRMAGEGPVSLETHPRSPEIKALFLQAGLKVEIVPDVNALVWGKLVVNSAINPLTALLRFPNGILLERPTARMIMSGLARETAAVALALGVSLPFTDPVAAVEEVARRTAANRSSMFQDVTRGVQTEIDAICGEIVHKAELFGVPVPINWTMWQLVKALSAG